MPEVSWFLTDGVAAAGQTALTGCVSVIVFQASLAVGPVRVVNAVDAVTSVTRGTIQLCIEVTFGTLAVTVTG